MWLFYSVIKRQLALLSLGWVSVKCITHQKTVKRRRFEVNKLHNVTSSSARYEQALIGTRHYCVCVCVFFSSGKLNPSTLTDTRVSVLHWYKENGKWEEEEKFTVKHRRSQREKRLGQDLFITPFLRWDGQCTLATSGHVSLTLCTLKWP